MGTLSREEMGNASGIFNLMRNVGGSVGISVVTTLLARKAQLHQNDLAAHLNLGDLSFGVRTQSLQRLFQGYFDQSDAARMAQGRVYGELQRQATLLAYVENFRLLAFVCFFCSVGAFFLKRVKAKGPSAGGH
jgi:MFS transporter, DHA2 family, multidrug resistance protein